MKRRGGAYVPPHLRSGSNSSYAARSLDELHVPSHILIKLEYTAGGPFSLKGCPDTVIHDSSEQHIADDHQQDQQQQQQLQQQDIQQPSDPALAGTVLAQSHGENSLLSSCNAGRPEDTSGNLAPTDTVIGSVSNTADNHHQQGGSGGGTDFATQPDQARAGYLAQTGRKTGAAFAEPGENTPQSPDHPAGTGHPGGTGHPEVALLMTSLYALHGVNLELD
eukprot:gene3231-3508_t